MAMILSRSRAARCTGLFLLIFCVTPQGKAQTSTGNRIEEVVYQNANHISQKDLEEITRLRKGAPLVPALVREARWRLEDALKEKGRYFAHVSILEGAGPDDRRVVFNVTEGPVVRVRRTLFVGNNSASEDRLRSHIETGGYCWGLVTGKFNVNIETINGDVRKIEDYYRAQGYLDVHVTRELVFTPDLRLVDITFHIAEGPRYQVKDVRIKGCKLLQEEDLRPCIRLKQGAFYSEPVIRADMRRITDHYSWCGYMVNVEKEQIYLPERGDVRVQYVLRETKPARGSLVLGATQ